MQRVITMYNEAPIRQSAAEAIVDVARLRPMLLGMLERDDTAKASPSLRARAFTLLDATNELTEQYREKANTHRGVVMQARAAADARRTREHERRAGMRAARVAAGVEPAAEPADFVAPPPPHLKSFNVPHDGATADVGAASTTPAALRRVRARLRRRVTQRGEQLETDVAAVEAEAKQNNTPAQPDAGAYLATCRFMVPKAQCGEARRLTAQHPSCVLTCTRLADDCDDETKKADKEDQAVFKTDTPPLVTGAYKLRCASFRFVTAHARR